MEMDLQLLLQTVSSSSVIRYSCKLAPLSADGLVCPPTYAAKKSGDPSYLPFRQAYIDGALRDIVVLDSPQSQSNRIESALLEARKAGRLAYPDIVVEFPSDLNQPSVSVLELSHRVYDAVLRAAMLDDVPFYETPIGRALAGARPNNATALFEHAPITLVLGAWDSNSGAGPQAAKLQRLLTSEIIGLDARPASLSATKFDVLDIRSNSAELIATPGDGARRFEIAKQKNPGKVKKPSEFGFGSVPSTDVPRGAVISGAVQTSVLSCAGLRALSFPAGDGTAHAERDQAARAVLAALALYGFVAQSEAGYLLRSRCELVPEEDGCLESIGRTLKDSKRIELSADGALSLLQDTLRYASDFGLRFRDSVLHLNADDRLIELVRRSRLATAAGDGEGEA